MWTSMTTNTFICMYFVLTVRSKIGTQCKYVYAVKYYRCQFTNVYNASSKVAAQMGTWCEHEYVVKNVQITICKFL